MATSFSTADVLSQGQDLLNNMKDTFTGQNNNYDNEAGIQHHEDAFKEHDLQEDGQIGEPQDFVNEASNKQENTYPRSLYFIRKPRPDLTLDDIQIQKYRLQFEQQKLIFQQYQETGKIIMVKRDQARESTQKALDAFRSTKTEMQSKRDKLSAYNVSDPKKREKIRELEKQLPPNVKSEEDLDNLLNSINYSLTHETLSLQQEKKFVGDLTRLQKLRPLAQEFEENFREVQKQRDDSKQVEPDRNKTRQELDQLSKQKDMAGNIYGECKKQQDTIRDNLTEVLKKRDEAKLLKDTAYDDWVQAKEAKKLKMQEFRQNREFSKEIRSLVESSNFEEAISMCNDQIEEMMEQLYDKNYRKEYIKLWEVQKSRPFLEGDFKADNTMANDNENLSGKVKIPKETDDAIKQAISNVNKASKLLPTEQEQADVEEPVVSEKTQTKEPKASKVSDKQVKSKDITDTKPLPDIQNGAVNAKNAAKEIGIQDFELPTAIVGKNLSQAKQDEANSREYNQKKYEEAERRKLRQEERRVTKQRKREEMRQKDEQSKLDSQQQESAAEVSEKENNDPQPVTSGDELTYPQEKQEQPTKNGSAKSRGKSRNFKNAPKAQSFKPPKKQEKSQSQKVLLKAQRYAERNQTSIICGSVVFAVLLAGIIYTIAV